MKRAWFTVLSTLAIGFGFLAAPLLAQFNSLSPEFVYVANGHSQPTLSGYYVDHSTGALTFSRDTVVFTSSAIVGGRDPSSLAVNPNGHFQIMAAEYAYGWLVAPAHNFRIDLRVWLVLLLPNFIERKNRVILGNKNEYPSVWTSRSKSVPQPTTKLN